MANLDLSGIITRICADLKTKFSKVTFRKDSTGDFDIFVDGTRYHIALPAPASQRPIMDGTAAVGTSTMYARADHVHPTDTSRQATLVSGTNIKTVNSTSLLGSGDVSVQPTLVSGTNIKTINGTSLLGGGNISTAELPTVTASDNGKVLRVVSGAWAAASLPSANGVSF